VIQTTGRVCRININAFARRVAASRITVSDYVTEGRSMVGECLPKKLERLCLHKVSPTMGRQR
jgi:hypothetical protein